MTEGMKLDKLPPNLLSVTLSKLTKGVDECVMFIGLIDTNSPNYCKNCVNFICDLHAGQLTMQIRTVRKLGKYIRK